MTVRKALLDELLEKYEKPEDLLGTNGILKQLSKSLIEHALEGEMTEHLGYPKHSSKGNNSGNSRNGKNEKTLKGELGEVPIETPRDREGTFEPQIIRKGQTRFDGFDEKIISMYARGMTTTDIRNHLREIYGVEVSSSLISNVTSEVMDDVKLWQNRPLDPLYPIVYLDAIRVKSRSSGHIENKAVYLAIGVNIDGHKEVLGMWIAQTEGAKFWLRVITEIKNRGVKDIFIACVDGLKGFPEAIEAVYPDAQVQLCIVHLLRHSLRFVSWKQRKEMAVDLKTIYQATTVDEAEDNLKAFAEKWDATHPTISKSWRSNWDHLIPFFGYSADIRKAIYTTNAIESLNMSLRRVIKNKGSFPNDEAIMKQIYLSLQNITKSWSMPIKHWKKAMNQFAILFESRMIYDD